MNRESRILVAGQTTMIGSAIRRELDRLGYANVCPDIDAEPDWADRAGVEAGFGALRPEYVFLAAGKTAGIGGNLKSPADLMLDNLRVVSNIVDIAYRAGVKKLLYLASSCCYPRDCPQPMKTEYLFSGPLEPTNKAYAMAKIVGIELCQAYRAQHGCRFVVGIPSNPFGPGDDFSSEDSHVIPSLIRKMHQAKLRGDSTVEVWGSGRPRRDFIYTEDLADACVFVMSEYDGSAPINLGADRDISIAELAKTIKSVVGFKGELAFNADKPDGMPRKCLDAGELLGMGWKTSRTLEESMGSTYDWYARHCGGKV